MKKTALLFTVLGLSTSIAMAQNQPTTPEAAPAASSEKTLPAPKPGKYQRRDGTHNKKQKPKTETPVAPETPKAE